MTELKPCPFCGGEAETKRIGTDGYGIEMWVAECKGCYAQTVRTNAERWAVRHWNRRAERTCRFERVSEMPGRETGVAEFAPQGDVWHYRCTSCGFEPNYVPGWMKYCPQCGARAEGE